MLATLFYHQPSLQYHIPDSMALRCKDSPTRLTYRMGTPNRECRRINISKHNDINSSSLFFIKNHDDHIEFSLDVPGVKIDDLSVKVENGVMTVSGLRSIGIRSDSPVYKRRQVLHRFEIDDRVDSENVTANLLNGVLTISLPKAEPSKQVQIQINEGHNNVKEDNEDTNHNDIQSDTDSSNDEDIVIVETVENKEEVMGESNGAMKS
jgi:HSP20 family molecular chaperone IbpA